MKRYPNTVQEWLDQNAEALEAEALEYAQSYSIPLEQARHEVRAEYVAVFAADVDELRYSGE